jgi:hypothetical protein
LPSPQRASAKLRGGAPFFIIPAPVSRPSRYLHFTLNRKFQKWVKIVKFGLKYLFLASFLVKKCQKHDIRDK